MVEEGSSVTNGQVEWVAYRFYKANERFGVPPEHNTADANWYAAESFIRWWVGKPPYTQPITWSGA